MQAIGAIDYRGAVYGENKQAFFDDIDVMIFPSQYVHEAEPVTVIEALDRGIPVIATSRGCVATLVPSECGCVIPGGTDFPERALCQLRDWMQSPESYRLAAQNARKWAERSHHDASTALAGLCSEISTICNR
jgi:glycosyltransferase involved in cell wall biosynthesis